jgi:hypothetical protein
MKTKFDFVKANYDTVTDDIGRRFSVGDRTKDGEILEFIEHGGNVYAWLDCVSLCEINSLDDVLPLLTTDDDIQIYKKNDEVYVLREDTTENLIITLRFTKMLAIDALRLMENGEAMLVIENPLIIKIDFEDEIL